MLTAVYMVGPGLELRPKHNNSAMRALIMGNPFGKPVARFIAGFLFAVFIVFPVMWILVGPPTSPLYVVTVIVAGVLGGFWWTRKPPGIYRPTPDLSRTTPGLFGTPSLRFLAGFFAACVIFIGVIWATKGTPTSLEFVAPMIAVGIVCGVMAARRSTALFW